MAAISVASLASFFSDENQSLERGENHYLSSHIESFNYSDGEIRGEVHASRKKKVYKVTIQLDGEYNELSSVCECPRGEFKCSHAAALCIHALHHLSRTDVECQWRKRKATITSRASVEEMFPPQKMAYNNLLKEPTAEDRGRLHTKLKNYGKFTGIGWLLSPEPPAQPDPLPISAIGDIIRCKEFIDLQDPLAQIAYFLDRAKLDQQAIEQVSRLTAGQQGNAYWKKVRQSRLTSSNFGHVLNSKKMTPSLIKRALGEYKLDRIKVVQWGITNECEALKAFSKKTGLQVVKTGVWLHQSGLLGASPDGLVGDNCVLEAKCPYTQRNQNIEEALLSNNFYLEKANGKVPLKKDHIYWHQIQGQMYLANAVKCYFVVWTTKDFIVLEIPRDEAWATNIEKLKTFYLNHLLPEIIKNKS